MDSQTMKRHKGLSPSNNAARGLSPGFAPAQRIFRKNGPGLARGVYAFLSDIGAPQHLAAFALNLKQSEQTVFLEEQSMLWDQIMQVLDRFALLPEDLTLDGGQILELFELSIGTMKVSNPPQTLDQTAVGTAKRMRPENPAAVFLLGAIEGEFPAVSDLKGLFRLMNAVSWRSEDWKNWKTPILPGKWNARWFTVRQRRHRAWLPLPVRHRNYPASR
jgi:hypothetical protein